MSAETKLGYELIETALAVPFDVKKTEVDPSPNGGSVSVCIEMQFGEDADDDPADIAEWGAFAFIFTLAMLSFADARPRGVSERDYVEGDDFGVADLIERLTFRRGKLHFHADYVRGRCVKTTITVTDDGRAVLRTWNRGEGALHWVERLKGKKAMEVVR
jgi:hypothetical protein